MRNAVSRLSALLALVGLLGACKAGGGGTTKDGRLVFEGTLTWEETGKPVAGADVRALCAEQSEQPKQSQEGDLLSEQRHFSFSYRLDNGRVLNPSISTDDTGHFLLEVPRSLYSEECRQLAFEMSASGLSRPSMIRGEDRSVVVFEAKDDAGAHVDFGTVKIETD
jgi:hypothetical protein